MLRNTPYAYYSGTRAMLFTFNCFIWYLSRSRTRLCSRYFCLGIYVSNSAFVFYFPQLLHQADSETYLRCMIELNVNILSFVFATLFFVITGTIGFYSCYWFVWTIYAAIKVD